MNSTKLSLTACIYQVKYIEQKVDKKEKREQSLTEYQNPLF
jgi:hypothetical protein